MRVPVMTRMPDTQVPEPGLARFLWADTRLAPIWVLVRFYLAYQWLTAGWRKLQDPEGNWVGANGGKALNGFVGNAIKKTEGANPQVMGWYGSFLEEVVQPNAALFAALVTFGELLVGLGLLVGCVTGIAAFFGLVMNTNYLLAGAISTNPVLVILTIGVLLAWRVAGYWGLDRWVLPLIGVPGVRDARQAVLEQRAARAQERPTTTFAASSSHRGSTN